MSQAAFLDRSTHLPDIETLTGDVGGAVGPTGAGNLIIQGGSNIGTAGFPAANTIQINLDDTVIITGAFTSASVTTSAITVSTFGAGVVMSTAGGVLYSNPGAGTLGTATTVGAVTADVITIPLGAVAMTYSFEARVAAFEATTPAGAGYKLWGAVRTTGAAGTVCNSIDQTVNEEAALLAANATIVVAGNSAILRVTGVPGLTIEWSGTLEYITAS